MGPPEDVPGGWLTDCNFTTRGVESLADDLVVRNGRVRSRVALLLRSSERQPVLRQIFPGSSSGSLPPLSGPLHGVV